jgi:cellulose synthase/poly-beta-1,6-N-acetylglucosamine synthase-like glycosyltransferase
MARTARPAGRRHRGLIVHDAAPRDHLAGLVTPAAVRLVDLERPLVDLSLRCERGQTAYRSLLAVARLDGEPLGAVAVPVSARGHVSGDWLAEVLRCELDSELRDAFARQGLHVPKSLPRRGIKKRSRGRAASAGTSRLVSVVVTGSHDPMLLERCLRSIFDCSYPDFEVIVVQRRPPTRATTRVLEERFEDEPRLRCVVTAGAGVSSARNVGLAHANGDIVMFSDGDVIVDAHWIGRCRAAFDRNRRIACVTGLVLPRELDDEGLLREPLGSVASNLRRTAFCVPDGRATHPFFYYTPGAMGSGANTALRADVARELGGFDPVLGAGTPALGGEDLDLYVRLLQAGHIVASEPSVIAWHWHPDRPVGVRRRALRQGVSVGAALTKQLVVGPRRCALLRTVPAGVRYELQSGGGADWPRRVGVALAPIAYAASATRSVYARWAASRPALATRADRALVAVAAAACVLAPVLVGIGGPAGARFAAVLALLCLAPGTAVVAVLGRRPPSAEPGLVVGASFGVAALFAQTMLWLGAWWPTAFLYALAVLCLVPLLAWCRELVPHARAPSDGPEDATDDGRHGALSTWVTDVELASPVRDLRPPHDPTGVRNGHARVLARLHGQPMGFVDVPLRDGTLDAADLVAAVDAQLSSPLAAHLARDGLQPGPLTPEGLPSVEAPACAAAGFYGEREPFVSVILSAAGQNATGALAVSLEAVLGADYPAFEVVVARAGSRNESRSDEVEDPRVHYVYEPSADPWKARDRAVGAADGDVLAFTDSDVVVDANWIRALVHGLTPAARVGCVTGPVLAVDREEPQIGLNFAVSREALLGAGGFEGIGAPAPTGDASDTLIQQFLGAGWAVSHEAGATAWRLHRRAGGRATLTASAAMRTLREWLAHGRNAVSGLSHPQAVAHGMVLAAAGVAWALSLRGADLSPMAGLGLVNGLPAWYFIAVGLLLAGFTASLTSRDLPHRQLWLYAIALVFVVHGTTPLLYDEPRYPWTFKHLGVIALIGQDGAVDRGVDIYNNWPGFFALAAWLSAVTGVGAISYAAWAQVFFNLANLVAVRFALRGVTNDERLLWTASVLFVLGNWLGQDYLAPQSFAFVLSLVILGLCLRCAPAAHRAGARVAPSWIGALVRARRSVPREEPAEAQPSPAPLSPAAATAVGGMCYLAIVVSHQLTPVILLTGVLGLALVARRVPLWVPLAMAAMEAWWLWRGWPYLSLHFSLLDPAPSSSAAPSGYSIGDGLPGLALVAYAVRVEVVMLVVLAAVGLVRRLRHGHWDLAAATLVVAPVVIVGLQSYGGESRYRVYLFALPWLCFFAAVALSPAYGRRHALTHRAALALASGCLGACLLLAYFGLELMNRVDPDDVAVTRWFERHAPSDSLLVGVTSNFPQRVTARYPVVYDRAYPGAPSLTDHAGYRRRRLGRRDVPRIERTLREYGVPHTFLALTASEDRYARLYGLLPAGSRQSLERALRTSPDFRFVYRRGTSSIFEYLPGQHPRSEATR